MKKILYLFAILPLFASCNLENLFGDAFDEMTKVSPTIKGYEYTVQSSDLSDANAEKYFQYLIVSDSKFSGKTGDKCKAQVVVRGNIYDGEPDKLGIYYYITGKMTYTTPLTVTFSFEGKFKYINGTWIVTRSDEGDTVTLKNGSKYINLKFKNETD